MKLLRWLPQLSLRWRESPIDRRLKRESEEWAFRLARESNNRAMGPTLEHTVIQLFDSLEQRVTALEEEMGALNFRVGSLELVTPLPSSATPSRATESHIKGDPLGVERDSTTLPTLRFSPSDPRIIKGGHAERLSEFAEPEDA